MVAAILPSISFLRAAFASLAALIMITVANSIEACDGEELILQATAYL